ncbi:MAG: hypothetical protein KAX38_09385, partial [Candidatus Krumholzibacteria bacterium]|nr:hypothetical protein [Candidatus Krumholzibacteria bacterium]
MKRAILPIVALSLLLSLGCSKKEDLVVAEVGTKKITVAKFEELAEVMENKYLPLTDDLEGKKELLQHIINKEIMTLKA